MAQQIISPRRRWSAELPPYISGVTPLRVVLLGKSASESSRVGNSILGRSALDSEAPPDVVERVGGRVKDRHVTLINSPHLLQTNISEHQITQTLRECVSLSDPGPHVIVLTLQCRDFNEEDRNRVTSVLKEFSEEALRHTIIITTDEENVNECMQQLSTESAGGHLQFEETKPEWSSEVLNRVDEMLQEKQEQYLKCEIFYDVKESSVSEEKSRSEEEKKKSSHNQDDEKAKERQKEESYQVSAIDSKKHTLNLALCGNDMAHKISVSKLLRGKGIKSSNETEFRPVCVKKEGKINGRLLSVVELPALSRLSEEEVMHQTLLSVTLCHPGVHAFIIIVPVGPLNNDERSEIEKTLKMFDSKEHFMLLFTTDLSVNKPVRKYVKFSSEPQKLISRCGGHHRLMGLNEPENSSQIPDLMNYIENMKTETYSLQMYMKTQEKRVRRETEERYEEELKRMENEIKELKQKFQTQGAEDDLKSLRIVLIGKTGNGKSATGNTILGKEEFVSEASMDSVTTVCVKGVSEAHGQSVSVVDTPGLFDTKLSNEKAVEEIVKCVALSSPGPHAFLIVLSLGRFTKEELETLDLIKMIFGPKAAQFSIVLFTRGDELGNKTIQDYVRESKSAEFKKLIRDCGNRFLVFNNKEKQDRAQVNQLIKMIEEIKHTNHSLYFTNIMFEEAEMSIKKRMEEIMKEREKEIQKEREQLQALYEMEIKNMMKRLEEEKQRADEERMKMENQFTENEEKLRKEFEEKEKMEQKKRESEYQKQLEEENQQKAEYQQKTAELMMEIENQRSEYEKQQKEREEEDRKREEKYRQDQEKMKNEQELIFAALQKKQHEETEKRESEENRRIKEEEEERQRWEKKMKEAENEKKEIQEEIKRQQKEWEDDKKRQMREREEEERKRKEKHEEQLREKQEDLEKMRQRFEREREEERQKIEEEREKQGNERKEKEREYEEKKTEMERHYEQLEQERKKEWERTKREDDERREEERKIWKEMIEDLKQEQEEEMKRRKREEEERKEREEEERDEMKLKHEQEIKEMQKKHEDEARKQAEEFNDFKERNEQQIQELQEKLEEHQNEFELLEKLFQYLKDEKSEEKKNLKKQIEDLQKKKCRVM